MKRLLAFIFALAFISPAFADSLGSATGGTRATQSNLAGCQYVNGAITLTVNQQSGVTCTVDGSVRTVESGQSYVHISTNTNTVVKASPGVIHTLMLGSKGGAGEIATLYDNTTCSGTVIAVVDLAGNDATSQTYDAKFNTGLCITTGSGTVADITVTYR